MRCVQCEGSSSPVLPVSKGYCEICGFGFYLNDDQTYSNVTCRVPRDQAFSGQIPKAAKTPKKTEKTEPKVEPKAESKTDPEIGFPATGKIGIDAVPVAYTSPPSVPTASSASPLPAAPSAPSTPSNPLLTIRVLAAIRSHGPVGKAQILESSGVAEQDYLGAIQALLSSGAILKEGEKRGTKYRVTPNPPPSAR